jgi:hypothetical protein
LCLSMHLVTLNVTIAELKNRCDRVSFLASSQEGEDVCIKMRERSRQYKKPTIEWMRRFRVRVDIFEMYQHTIRINATDPTFLLLRHENPSTGMLIERLWRAHVYELRLHTETRREKEKARERVHLRFSNESQLALTKSWDIFKRFLYCRCVLTHHERSFSHDHVNTFFFYFGAYI